MGLQADFMQIDMNTKEIYAYGKADSVDGKPKNTHPVFSEGGSSYTMDTITYNFGSKKAFIQGVATQEGDGWLVGGQIKKMPDNSINIRHGKNAPVTFADGHVESWGSGEWKGEGATEAYLDGSTTITTL
jgi:prepilin-type processing-associated H-X9-DG protein